MRHVLLASCGCAAMLMGWAGSAAAQESDTSTVEEIIVTATKTGATNIQETPIAITAVTSDMIDEQGLHDIRDLANATPNLVITSNGSFAQVYIRGVGSNNIFAGSDPSSTLHLDGIYIARPAAYLNTFLDVERIEVLRGPQGTLYGRNSAGGTINIIARRPSNDFMAKAQFTAGNYNLLRGEGYVSGPIVTDKVAASLAVLRTKRDGYVENVVAGQKDPDSEDAWAVRGQLRFTPSDNFEVIVRADHLETDEIGLGTLKILQPTTNPVAAVSNTLVGNFDKIALNSENFSKRRVRGIGAEANWKLTENLTLTSLTAYRESRLNSQSDTDGTELLVRITKQFEDQNQWSQELNLTGSYDNFNFVLGAYWFDEHILADSTVSNFVPGTRVHPNPTVDTTAWAVYGQGSYNFTDKFSLTIGVRYTEEDKKFAQNYAMESIALNAPLATYPRIYTIKGKYTALTPKFGVEYRASDDLMFYASMTRGFKSGGFNFASANPAQGYTPETLWSYEGGFKSDLLDQRLRLNGTIFRYKYEDLQVQSFLTPGVIDITNASDAEVTGVELEMIAKPTAALEFGGYLTLLEAVYQDYPSALKPGNIPFDASGQRINSSPKWSYNIYGQYRFELVGAGTLTARAEYVWKDQQFFTPENNRVEQQGEYGLINAHLAWKAPGEHFTVIAYGRNLADEKYVTSTGTFTGVVSGKIGEPRVYGLRLAWEY